MDTYITSEYKVNTGRSKSTASVTWQGPEEWAGLRALLTVVSTPKKDQNENLLTDPTEVVNSDSGLLQLQASFLSHTPLESLGGSFPGLSDASGALRDREGRPTEGGRRGATSSFWAWDLRKLVTGHAPPPSSHWPTAGTCPLLSSLHPGVSFGSVYFSLSTYWTQAGLGIPSYLVRWEGGGVTEAWMGEMTHPRSNYCFPGLVKDERRGEGLGTRGRGATALQVGEYREAK